MSDNTKIEWADHTFNPWEGCQKTGSPACDNCYAETRNARFNGGVAINWGPHAPRRRTSPANWSKPLKWQAQAELFRAEHGRRQRVFCASLADVFDNQVDPLWRCDLAELIEATPDLDWLLLTKRIGNAAHMLKLMFARPAPSNVWLGATIADRAEMLRDAPKLLATAVRTRFWSVEPMLGDLGAIPYYELLPDWVICGGESGPSARPMHPDWPRSLRDQCAAAGVPFFFKQWGVWLPSEAEDHPVYARPHSFQGGMHFYRLGKKRAGRLLDGREHNEFPSPPGRGCPAGAGEGDRRAPRRLHAPARAAGRARAGGRRQRHPVPPAGAVLPALPRAGGVRGLPVQLPGGPAMTAVPVRTVAADADQRVALLEAVLRLWLGSAVMQSGDGHPHTLCHIGAKYGPRTRAAAEATARALGLELP